MIASLFVHAGVGALLVLIPLLLTDPPPPLRDDVYRVLLFDPPPPPPPPPLRGPGLTARPVPRPAASPTLRREAPLVPPATTAPAPEPKPEESRIDATGGHPEGGELGQEEGMEGGVEGGVVGGLPGGVVGGVIGGTGTGPVPVPVLRPDRPPRPLRMTRPQYPQEAFTKKVEGTVVVEILIDERGRVARARVVRSVPLLDAAALVAVRSWVFIPAVHGGRDVATLAFAPITFRIY
jgi:protein TonB